ncbi:MAG: hypothetical protein Q9165_007167 [Trypethelium subeluteriae]
MSTRQTSFFDQDCTSKKPRWQTYRKHERARGPDQEKSTVRGHDQPPIMPSAESRSKLKAFQFIEGRPSALVAPANEKENMPQKKLPNVSIQDGSSEIVKKQNINTQASSQEARPPATPATRLPLADLIGNVDETTRRRVLQDTTPEDHLHWMPDSSFSTTKTPRSRSRKRAHSSSPPSSQHERSAHFPSEKQNLNLEHVKQLLRTPQVDPIADLWNRYAPETSNRETPNAQAQPVHLLINESSPHSPDAQTSGSKSGLRRWASEGNQWLHHRAKRRKTVATAYREQIEDVFADKAANVEQSVVDGSRTSRVGFLVERMQETLLKQPPLPHDNDDPSSSSPLPEHGVLQNEPSQLTSPLQKLGDVGREQDQLHPSRQTAHYSQGSKPPGRQPSSEAESEDLTTGMLQALKPAHPQAHGDTASSIGPDASVIKPLGDDLASQDLTEAAAILKDAQGLAEFFDDFDEGDVFSAGMENVASRYDTQPKLDTKEANTDQSTVARQSTVGSATTSGVINPSIRMEKEGEAICIDDDEDDFGVGDIDDEAFATAEVMTTQSHRSTIQSRPSESEQKAGKIQRYLVTDIIEGEYTTKHGVARPEKVLLVKEEKSKMAKAVTLRQSWYDTPCTPNSYVHVIGDFSHTGQCTIDDASNMIILHPDHLISATVVADSFECIRRAVLQDRVKATSTANEPQVYGQILHELFQEAMTANRWDTEWLIHAVEGIVLRHLESIYELNLTIPLAIDAIRTKLPELQAWARSFVREEPGPETLIKDRSGKDVAMSISKLLDVEEHVLSPKFGLKGNIDATMEVVMNDEDGKKRLTVPFEVKTGSTRAAAAHRAQTALYTLLLSDRYDINVLYGILYYMERSEISRVAAIRHEIRHMIMQRNELACYVRSRLELPPVLEDSHKCKNCYAKVPCFVYHKLAEDGAMEESTAKQEFDGLVKGLKLVHAEFFKKWDRLITKEESEMTRFRRELWTMLSTEREKLGRCFSNVVLEPDSFQEQAGAMKINRFKYTFVKQKKTPGFSFTESQLTVGEPIVISDEKGHFALANGYVTSIGRRRISVAVDRRLHNARVKQDGFDDEMNQVFAGIMEVGESSQGLKHRRYAGEEVVYRLDKDEFSNGMATVRNNLIQMMTSEYHARELRALIVEDVPPKFKADPSAYSLSGPRSQDGLNSDQKTAVEKVMAAEDYALVLGMPGTGKTTTIAHIIRALVAKGKSVLLTSYTHTAVDNILLKIRDNNIDILRLGAIAKVHPEVREFAQLAAEPRKSIEELQEIYTKPQVVATTCLGINHHVFQERIFDYCIVDEASQITLPVCLGPIRMAKTFILVGDHYQLPPLVQNKEALEGGLDVSLFKLLSDRRPESVVSLEHQYRMCEDIMLLSNTLIYNGRLKCGNEAVARRSLSIPDRDGLLRKRPTQLPCSQHVSLCECSHLGSCWIDRLLSPTQRVTFANTDILLPTSLEECKGARITNDLEAQLTTQLVESLLAVGIAASDIGIITFYRSQLALLRQSLKHRPEVEMHTADRFQGRDKEVIVLSCVRSNEAANVGDLLRDWRRVNVAFTRARSKLVILGSRRTLCGNELLGKFVQLVEEKGWRYDLPKGTVEAHGELRVNSSETQKSPSKESPKRMGPKKETTPRRSPLQAVSADCSSQRFCASPSLLKMKSPDKAILGEVKNRKFKQPTKVGKINKDSIVGSRPVLRDIVNDALS